VKQDGSLFDTTVLKAKDIDNFVNYLMNLEYNPPKCSWCKECMYVREVGPNYICPNCEKVELEAGRPLVFTSPVSNAYFEVTYE